MPFTLPPQFGKVLILFETWNNRAPGQVVSRIKFSHSKKFSIGVLSSPDISFLFLSLTAPSMRTVFKQVLQAVAYNNMDRYKIIKEVGNGSFGVVWRALNKQNGEVVAIKKMKRKYYSWEECINLREVKSLRKMNHPNIVKLKEVIRENDILYFVFEYMEFSLYQLMKDRVKLFLETEIRNWCFQVFQGLAYMHQRGYFHRDLKPENFLVSKDIIKIADFGLARETVSLPPYTEYVSTRWYRAPEVLLQASTYGPAVDMWAMGAIMSELFTLRPLFPGSSEADEIYKICSVIGSPTENSWAEGLELAGALNYQFPELAGVNLSALVPSASKDAVNLIASLCSWDPCKRPSASEALQHPFFQSCYYIPPSLRPKPTIASPKSTITRTPPSGLISGRRVVEQKCVKKDPGSLSISKPVGNNASSVKVHASLNTGVHRRLEMNRQDGLIEKTNKNSVRQPKYQPPMKNNQRGMYMGKGRGIGDTTEKLGNMTIGNGRGAAASPLPPLRPHPMHPPPMKAGAANGKSSDLFTGRSQGFSSKVAG